MDREEFLQFLHAYPGMEVTDKEDDVNVPYFHNGYIEEPWGNPSTAPAILLRFVSQSEFERLEIEGELYDEHFTSREDGERCISEILGRKPQAAIDIFFRNDVFEGSLFERILREIAQRWGGICWNNKYYSGEESIEPPVRGRRLTLFPSKAPQPPTRAQALLATGHSTNVLFSRVCIDRQEFLDFMRGYPGIFVPDEVLRGAHNPPYDAYLEIADPRPGLEAYPMYVQISLHAWEDIINSPDPHEYLEALSDPSPPERVVQLLGAQPRSIIRIHFGSDDDMLAHGIICAIMRRWPCVYDTEVHSRFFTFTVEEVCKAVRHGVHVYYVRNWPVLLPPERDDEGASITFAGERPFSAP